MDERKPIVRKPLETITLEGVSGTSFGSRLSFTVGTSFLICRSRHNTVGSLGGLRGLATARPKNIQMSTKLFINHYLNNFFKYGLRWSTTAATTSRL